LVLEHNRRRQMTTWGSKLGSTKSRANFDGIWTKSCKSKIEFYREYSPNMELVWKTNKGFLSVVLSKALLKSVDKADMTALLWIKKCWISNIWSDNTASEGSMCHASTLPTRIFLINRHASRVERGFLHRYH